MPSAVMKRPCLGQAPFVPLVLFELLCHGHSFGVADLFAETGEAQLMKNLEAIWNDIVQHKIYIMGGCGALYDGVSPDGTTYDQPSIQQIHQAYGRQFQLPQEAAHNEICAQIGMLLFSWRMFQATADNKYIDIIENELYNGILSGISLDGKDYFYTEALRRTSEFPYTMRWPKHRQHYISCFCCPPNTLRTLCEAQEYAYSLSGNTVWVNLYGNNTLTTKDLIVEQTTDYPWDGKVTLTFKKVKDCQALMLHIPCCRWRLRRWPARLPWDSRDLFRYGIFSTAFPTTWLS